MGAHVCMPRDRGNVRTTRRSVLRPGPCCGTPGGGSGGGSLSVQQGLKNGDAFCTQPSEP